MLIVSTSLRSLRTRVRGFDAPKRPRSAAPSGEMPARLAKLETFADREAARLAEKQRLEATDGRKRVWHLGKWMTEEPQTPWPSDGRCTCGECGGVVLLPVGTEVVFRGVRARIADWAPQDCWNLPCVDNEGGVILGRDMLDGGPGYTLADAEGAARRTTALAASETEGVERRRLLAISAAWLDLSRRLLRDASARLNPTAVA